MANGSLASRPPGGDARSPTRFGIAVPQSPSAGTASATTEFAALAERAGFDSIWTQQQLSGGGGLLDPIVTCGFLAAVAERVGIGIAVLLARFRHPVVLANEIVALDHLTGGRALVGAGVGGTHEYGRLGVSDVGRGRIFEEGIALVQRLLEAAGDPVSGTPAHPVHGARVTPPPLTLPRPPILIGGSSAAALRRAAEIGDGWIGAGSTSPDAFLGHLATVHEELARVGRGPGFTKGKRVYIAVTPHRGTPPPRMQAWFERVYGRAELAGEVAVVGPVEACIDELARFTSAGADLLLLNPVFDERRHLEVLAERVLPALR